MGRNCHFGFSVLRVASGPRIKLASCKSALTSPPRPPPPPTPPPLVYSTDRSKAVVPVLVLLFVVCGLFYEAICIMSYLVLFCSCVFQSFLHCDYLAWGREGNLSAFRAFVRFALFWFCLFPLPLGVWEGLRFVIVALPGLFSYLFLSVVRDIHVASCTQKSKGINCIIFCVITQF